MERLICIVIGYVFGLFQTGYIYGKMNHIDIRKHGSGNAGTTNALRTLGWKAAVITFIGDCLKCILAVCVARFIFADHGSKELLALYAATGAVLGHNYPFYLKFKGGKGIASTVGLILAINPLMFIITAVVFIAILLCTQYVSVGSIVIMILFVVQVVLYGQQGGFQLGPTELTEFYVITIVLALLAIWRHRANIVRLVKGTENKINVFKIGKKENVEP